MDEVRVFVPAGYLGPVAWGACFYVAGVAAWVVLAVLRGGWPRAGDGASGGGAERSGEDRGEENVPGCGTPAGRFVPPGEEDRG